MEKFKEVEVLVEDLNCKKEDFVTRVLQMFERFVKIEYHNFCMYNNSLDGRIRLNSDDACDKVIKEIDGKMIGNSVIRVRRA